MTILSTQDFTGSASVQTIEVPEVPDRNARIVYVFDGHTGDLTLSQGADGPEIRIPADQGQPYPVGPWRLYSAPTSLLVAVDDSVTVSIIRVAR